MKAKDWGAVIRDYKRARQLYEDTKVDVFKDLLKGVEEIARSVRELLYEDLNQLPATLEHQRQIIHYLNELRIRPTADDAGPGIEASGGDEGSDAALEGGEEDKDPGWDCLTFQHKYVIQQVDGAVKALVRAQQGDAEEGTPGRRSFMSRERFKKAAKQAALMAGISRKLEVSSNVASKLSKLDTPISTMNKTSDDLRSALKLAANGLDKRSSSHALLSSTDDVDKQRLLRFVENTCNVLVEHLHQVWQLGNDWLTHAAKQLNASDFNIDQASAYDPDSYDAEDPAQQRIVDRKMEVEKMAQEIVDYTVEVLQTHFTQEVERSQAEDTLANLRVWLPQCEVQIRSAHRTLMSMKLAESCISGLVEFLEEVQPLIVTTLLSKVNAEIQLLADQEDWRPIGQGMHTKLPELYEEILMSTLMSLADICNYPAAENRTVVDPQVVEELMVDALDFFRQCLERLAFDTAYSKPVDCAGSQRLQSLFSRTDSMTDQQLVLHIRQQDQPVTMENRLLCVMSNCLYVTKHVSRRLAERTSNLGLCDLDQVRATRSILPLRRQMWRKFEHFHAQPGHGLRVKTILRPQSKSYSYHPCGFLLLFRAARSTTTRSRRWRSSTRGAS